MAPDADTISIYRHPALWDILDSLIGQPMTRKQLEEDTGRSASSVGSALAKLLLTGHVDRLTAGRLNVLYAVTPKGREALETP